MAEEVFPIRAVDVDVAVFAGSVVFLFTVEPENAGEDHILLFHRVGGLPDATVGFASDELVAGFGVVADLLTDPVPAERSFVAVGFGTSAFFPAAELDRRHFNQAVQASLVEPDEV